MSSLDPADRPDASGWPTLEDLSREVIERISPHQPPPKWVLELILRLSGASKITADDDAYERGRAVGRVHWVNLFRRTFVDLLAAPPTALPEEVRQVLAWLGDYRERLIEQLQRGLCEIQVQLAVAMTLPPEHQIRFFDGFADGLYEGWFDENGQLKLPVAHIEMYVTMVAYYSEIERLSTYKEVHQLLGRILGSNLTGDLESFRRFCNKFGLYKGRRGRPRKKRT